MWYLSECHCIVIISLKFIADIRGARVRELEEKRINKEMANIRKKFKGMLHVIIGVLIHV